MKKKRTGSGGRGKVIHVGGAEVRLISAGKSSETPSGGTTAGPRSVFVPSGGRGLEGFPAVARLVRSMCGGASPKG